MPENHPVLTHKRVVSATSGKHITINGQDCLNLGTHNYLGLLNSPDIRENAIAAIRKYGVGSCGPRGFYGTIGKLSHFFTFHDKILFFHDKNIKFKIELISLTDVHLELEERLAKFMQMEESVLYSYGFSTVASAIGAYCKRGDLLFV